MYNKWNDVKGKIDSQSPLIHCITSPIAINDCANAVLALGAKPIMAEHPLEVENITLMSKSLAVSLANITDARAESIMISGKTACKAGISSVIDLVGVTCSKMRADLAKKYITQCRPAVIKGNVSEIKAVCGMGFDESYGIDVSMETLGALYETDINYYVRLNFSSLIEIVDILGGVDVYSEYAFTTGWESGYEMEVQQGINHFDGKQALAFSRERHALEGGDNQRGKNQQAVITAMLKKVLSPTMLLKANSIINQVSQDVETNISQGQLNSLVKSQLKSGAKWTIQSVAASGTASATTWLLSLKFTYWFGYR